jgi:hypothetical protein
MIYMMVCRVKRGMQWDRCQIRVSGRGRVHGKKGLKMIGTTTIRMKRGIQWDRSQIMGWVGPNFFFFTLAELYSDLNNTAVSKYPNS